jgi:hypothetical protein
MRADLFNRVAWQLASRGGVRVYAWMPVLSLALDDSYPRVSRWNPADGQVAVDPGQYQRLSPFNARNRAAIGRLRTWPAMHRLPACSTTMMPCCPILRMPAPMPWRPMSVPAAPDILPSARIRR